MNKSNFARELSIRGINCDKEKAIEYWNNGVKDTRETTWSPQVDAWNKRS